MKLNFFYRIAIFLATGQFSIAATSAETLSNDVFQEAYHLYASKYKPTNAHVPLSDKDQKQLDQLLYLSLNKECLHPLIIPFSQKLETLGTTMFVGGTVLQESISGALNKTQNITPFSVSWGRLAIAQASTVMVDGDPVASPFAKATSSEIQESKPNLYAHYKTIGYREDVLNIALKKLVDLNRIFPCNFEQIPASYNQKFDTILFDGSVYYNMGENWKEKIIDGSKRFLKEGGLLILPMADNEATKIESTEPLKAAFEKKGGFQFVTFISNQDCKPYRTFPKNPDGSTAEPYFPDPSLYTDFFHELGGHLLVDANLGWELAIWQHKLL